METPKTKPYVIIVENLTDNDILNFEVLCYKKDKEEQDFKDGNIYKNGTIISSGIPGITVAQLLFQTCYNPCVINYTSIEYYFGKKGSENRPKKLHIYDLKNFFGTTQDVVFSDPIITNNNYHIKLYFPGVYFLNGNISFNIDVLPAKAKCKIAFYPMSIDDWGKLNFRPKQEKVLQDISLNIENLGKEKEVQLFGCASIKNGDIKNGDYKVGQLRISSLIPMVNYAELITEISNNPITIEKAIVNFKDVIIPIDFTAIISETDANGRIYSEVLLPKIEGNIATFETKHRVDSDFVFVLNKLPRYCSVDVTFKPELPLDQPMEEPKQLVNSESNVSETQVNE